MVTQSTQSAADVLSLAQSAGGTGSSQAGGSGDPFRSMLESTMQEAAAGSQNSGEGAVSGEGAAQTEQQVPEDLPEEHVMAVIEPIVGTPMLYIAEAVGAAGTALAGDAQQAVMQAAPETQLPQEVLQAQPQAEQESQAESPQILAAVVEDTPEEGASSMPVRQEGKASENQGQQKFDRMVDEASRQLQESKSSLTTQQSEGSVYRDVARMATQSLSGPAPQLIQDEGEGQTGQAIPVMTGQAQIAAQQTEAPVIPGKPMAETPQADQVSKAVVENLSGERSEFQMQLRPEALGRVDVRMVFEAGRLAVHIMAGTSAAADALRAQTEGLIYSLRIAGIQVESVQVVHQPEESSEHMGSAYNMMAGNGSGQEAGSQTNGGKGAAGQGDAQEGENPTDSAPQKPERLLDTAI